MRFQPSTGDTPPGDLTETGCRLLLAAVLAQAARDAVHGDNVALSWLRGKNGLAYIEALGLQRGALLAALRTLTTE